MSAGTTTQARTTKSGRGKEGYRAPELLLDSQQSYNKKVDIWSLGCILYELSVGMKPFSTDWAALQFAQEKSEMTVTIVGGSGAVCKNLQALICSMLKCDFRDRPSITMIREALGSLRPRTTPDSTLPMIEVDTSQSQGLAEFNTLSELRIHLAREGMTQLRLNIDMWHQLRREIDILLLWHGFRPSISVPPTTTMLQDTKRERGNGYYKIPFSKTGYREIQKLFGVMESVSSPFIDSPSFGFC